MSTNFITRRIKRAFSGAAMQYDMLASLHKEIGRDLAKQIVSPVPEPTVLEIGMGTGYFTAKLNHLFPGSLVVGIDFAEGMLDKAREREAEFKMVQADAVALPFKAESFDLITSNLCLQWAEDLELIWQRCFDLAKPGGALFVTLFGYATFQELFESVARCLPDSPQRTDVAWRRLPSQELVAASLMKVGFNNTQLRAERITVHFADLYALVKWTKDIGANALARDFYVGRDLLARAAAYYDARFRDDFGIIATFEVLWVSAQKT